MVKRKTNLILVSVLALGISGCSIGNHAVQHGENVQTFAGNIDVTDYGSAGILDATNGNITVSHHAQVNSATTTNGNISIGDHSKVLSVQTTNGNILLGKNTTVIREIKNSNGNIDIGQQAKLHSSISTVTGNITIASGVVIQGDIIFQPLGFLMAKFENQTPTLKLAKNVQLKGKIHLFRPVNLELNSAVAPENIIRHYLK
ncbi:hypothetical protein tinsulaeT_27920 [Thalassotalea insulae]|uniref:Adhesin domain-containing protein n=1 Tax=Thalassotalea insulae TaxID=2056778 RepID=A0ABQ6GU76_9GAMM|nr:hypothetical protein [Thalassotalea insulae]GLX79452.1 hypothetical protein tinsulaeT_27920 [Thalassotalea insulae]